MRQVCLIILDGYGIAQNPAVSAIDRAKKPFIDSLSVYPNTKLFAHGKYVGLPEGQFGNSEVGHLNIGAGRICEQDLSRINTYMKKGTISHLKNVKSFLKLVDMSRRVHLMGLFSNGGVHSSLSHLNMLITLLIKEFGSKVDIFIHAFTDGRDTNYKIALHDISSFLKKYNSHKNVKLKSVVGRYYAMDRDKRWERTQIAYELLVEGKGDHTMDPITMIENMYQKNITDEFIPPIHIKYKDDGEYFKDEDVVCYYNFRADRARQLSYAFIDQHFKGFKRSRFPCVHFFSMTEYDKNYKNIIPLFPSISIEETIGEVVSKANLWQLRIAETEKYAHVTYFFNGGRENPYPQEQRIMVDSPKVPTYDMKPEMSAIKVTDILCQELSKKKYHFIVLNYANPDMVGHTGNMEATIQAIETVDYQLSRVVNKALQFDYDILIIADHGNADCMIDSNGKPHTTHTLAQVPCIMIGKNYKGKLKTNGTLADVSPTLLKMMGIIQPTVMTGSALF